MTAILVVASVLAILASDSQQPGSKQPAPTPTGPATISYIPPKIPTPVPVAPVIAVSIHPGGPGDWPSSVNVTNSGNAASPAGKLLIRVTQTGGAIPCAKPFAEADAPVPAVQPQSAAVVPLGGLAVPKPAAAGPAPYTCTWKLTANLDAKLSEKKGGPGNTSAARTFSKSWP